MAKVASLKIKPLQKLANPNNAPVKKPKNQSLNKKQMLKVVSKTIHAIETGKKVLNNLSNIIATKIKAKAIATTVTLKDLFFKFIINSSTRLLVA